MPLSKLRIAPMLLVAFTFPAFAAECANPDVINDSLAQLNSYSDVPSNIACDSAQSTGEKLICASETLSKMAVIDDRAWVFAYEATAETIGTPPPLDDAWVAKRNACTDEACLCEVLKAHTNASLGPIAPYPAN